MSEQNEQQAEKGEERRPKITFTGTHEQIPRLYANNVELNFSSWDVRFTFGEILSAKGGEVNIQRIARVTMSLEHAKAFSDVLAKTLDRFEKAVGKEIPTFGNIIEE